MPPTAEATTGAFFHIASATVSPKASMRERWVTTELTRWTALTTVALTSRSSMLTAATWIREATDSGSTEQRSTIWVRVACDSGPSGVGPTSSRWASSGSTAMFSAKASTSSRPPLRRSQRLTWVTTRAPSGTGPPARTGSSARPRKASARPS